MTLNPVETLNVFSKELQAELRKRSFSKNLVRTRTPFLRFTTATNMANIEDVLGYNFGDYKDCKFFTLGLHGWDNKNYSASDLYGAQDGKGLVLGSTYNHAGAGEQKLVYAHGGIQGTQTFGLITVAQSPVNFPPPGVVSAKVERLRNGNVAKFTLEIKCYTQEQLEVLDAMCFIPGMTCILEWGTMYTTPNGVEGLSQILDFKKADIQNIINNAINNSRDNFIKQWCQPNNFNYDWAVGHIANVKTVLKDDTYNVTVVAYGRADNLMYISAYATSNPLNPGQLSVDKQLQKSVNEYFKLNGAFSTFLKTNVNNRDAKIIRFYDEFNRAEQSGALPVSSDTGTVNDLGLEDSYFINFDYFITEILNKDIVNIINSAVSAELQLTRLLSPLIEGTDVITVGYNEYLRSTNPETMIIYNEDAIANANKRANLQSQQGAIIANLRRTDGQRYGYNNSNITNVDQAFLGASGAAGDPERGDTLTALKSRKFGSNIPAGQPSGITQLATGVWLNSKGIQTVFLNARTIMEGLEALLRNVNAATENYWDLKLFYDDDRQEFRILDDNVRDAGAASTQEKIYEFNRKLRQQNTDVLGPDVLDIQISTDYPKMLFSQLAISGINGLVSSPDRRDVDFTRNKGLSDLFSKKITPVTDIEQPKPPTTVPVVSLDVPSVAQSLKIALYGEGPVDGVISSLRGLLTPFNQRVPPEVGRFLTDIFSVRGLLTPAQANSYRATFENFVRTSQISQDQAAAITKLFAYRTRTIITGLKNKEREIITNALREWQRTAPSTPIAAPAPIIRDNPAESVTKAIINKITESENRFKNIITNAESAAVSSRPPTT